jgi:hypothetical protein
MELKYRIIPIHISEIKSGDTIKCRDGVIRTVSFNNIHHDKFCGTTIFGDSYNLGHIPVDKVEIFHAR